MFELLLLAPVITLVLFGIVILLMVAIGKPRQGLLVGLSILAILLAANFTLAYLQNGGGLGFGGLLVIDGFAVLFNFLLLTATLLVVLASTEYTARFPNLGGEYYALLLFACAGMMLMASTGELLSIYLALELTGISLYVLVGLHRDVFSSEAGIKYLLLGALSSAVLLYGMAILFGLTGTTELAQMGPALAQAAATNHPAVLLAIVMLVAGFGFKLATVPFQMWVPDVYQGAPTPVTAFLSVASKAAGFAVVLRVFHTALDHPAFAVDWIAIFAVLSLLSMTLGNVVAIQQRNIKRMMAYSSIAQAGYLMVGLAVLPQVGTAGVLFFLVSYTFTNLGAFIAIIALTDKLNSEEIPDFAGLWRRAPLLTLALTLCLLSLTGVPPTAGFFGKLFIFSAGVQHGLAWLVFAGVINSVVSAYYYLGVVKAMFLGTSASREALPSTAIPVLLALLIAAVATFVLGVLPGPAMTVAAAAAGSLVR